MAFSLTRYESFFLNNVSTISTLESSLRSVTWFLPGKFKDADLAAESLSTLLNIMSMYHDTLLAKVMRNHSKHKPLIPSSLHSRYTHAWSSKDSLYKWAARVLELIRFTELLIEMGLRRKVSVKLKWRSIVCLEAIKAILRLTLLRITRRPLVSPPIPEREFDPESLPPPSSATSSPTLVPSSSPSPPVTPEHLKNNHVPLPPHPLLVPPPPTRSETSVEDWLLSKALTVSSVKPSLALIRTLSSPQDWMAEIVHVLRPLVYVTLLASNKDSNRPLMTVLAMEFVSRYLRRRTPPSEALERSEYARRDRDIVWYLLRGSIWQSYTRPKLQALAANIVHSPMLGLFSGVIKDWVSLIDNYYYHTAL